MNLVETMKRLLEEERAQVLLLEQLAFYSRSKEANSLLASIRHDAAVSCEGLHSLIMQRGETVTNEISDLLEKVMDLTSWEEQFRYLIQEENHVLQMIDAVAQEDMTEHEVSLMRNLRNIHAGNIQKYRRLSG